MDYLPLKNVTLSGGFWGAWQEVNRTATIPAIYHQLDTHGQLEALRTPWKQGTPNPPHIFWDSDIAKWLEAACYSLTTHPDPALELQVNEVVALLASTQQADGYLNTHFTQVEPENRWTNERDQHELYCAGHLIEAAVAHYQATGERNFLDIMRRYTDYIATIFGPNPGQKRGFPGHQEIELALFKLYGATGEKRYFDLARFFIEERGRQPHYFDLEAQARGEDPAKFFFKNYEYNQAHAPLREQVRAVGHCVRAMYFYSAAADLAAETGDPTLKQALEQLFRSVMRQMYITGALGPSRFNEGFTNDYDLPNESAYAETCASIGLFMWMQRMLRLDLDGQYADVAERCLYNGILSGISLDGKSFFYENPLTLSRLRELNYRPAHHRQPWFDCACCPPNVSRLMASLGAFVYARDEHDLIIHHYMPGSASFTIHNTPVTLVQETAFPWQATTSITLIPARPTRFGLKLRIPGWCRGYTLRVNGSALEATPVKGYLRLEREWKEGDEVLLEMEMAVRNVYADPHVTTNLGRIALQRGPLVYCFEEVDNDGPLETLVLPRSATLETRFEPGLLGGIVTISGSAMRVKQTMTGFLPDLTGLYGMHTPQHSRVRFKAVPYYAWDNRTSGDMAVWMRESCPDL